MANVFDIEFTTATVSGYSSNQRMADAWRWSPYVKNSYVSSNKRKIARAAHHSTIFPSSASSITAPVGLCGELTITPRVRSVATEAIDARVGRKRFFGSVGAKTGRPSANCTWSGKLTQYGEGM